MGAIIRARSALVQLPGVVAVLSAALLAALLAPRSALAAQDESAPPSRSLDRTRSISPISCRLARRHAAHGHRRLAPEYALLRRFLVNVT